MARYDRERLATTPVGIVEAAGTHGGHMADEGEQGPPRVFISYAQESDGHSEAVRELWLLLLRNGIEAVLDKPAAERRRDWLSWMGEELRQADYVLVIASPEYRRRAEGRATFDQGRGVQYEAFLIKEMVYANRDHWFHRVLPVLLPGRSTADVPEWLGPFSSTSYPVPAIDNAGAERLLRVLLDQPYEVVPPLGKRPVLPPRPTGKASPGRGSTGTSATGTSVTGTSVTGASVTGTASADPQVDRVIVVPAGADVPLTAEERRLLLDELANVFSRQLQADEVLDAVGLVPMRRMRDGTSKIQWSANLREMTNGAVDTPYRRVLLAALAELPANAVFGALARRYGLT